MQPTVKLTPQFLRNLETNTVKGTRTFIEKKKSTLKLKHLIKQFQQKQNITTFMKAALIAGLLYSTASVLARCN